MTPQKISGVDSLNEWSVFSETIFSYQLLLSCGLLYREEKTIFNLVRVTEEATLHWGSSMSSFLKRDCFSRRLKNLRQ